MDTIDVFVGWWLGFGGVVWEVAGLGLVCWEKICKTIGKIALQTPFVCNKLCFPFSVPKLEVGC